MTVALPPAGFVPLVPADPSPTVDRIEQLANRILTGDILLPKFQRSFVWEKKKILALWDSIAKGFPIGSVLLWQSRQVDLRSEQRIAGLDIDLPRPNYPVNYLLDGQQRLSSICGVLFWRGTDPTSRWNVVYDLRAKKFLHHEEEVDPPLHQIRVSKLSDPSGYFEQVTSLGTLAAADKLQLQENAKILFNRFKDYKIATVTLGDMPLTDVAPIFERINSTATPLTIVDLMRAATWSPEFDLVDSIDSVLKCVDEKGFGEIDRRVILRNISAAVGGDFTHESIDGLRAYNSVQLKTGVQQVLEAYKRTVDFLSTEIGVPNGDVLPYANQLTVLSEIFRRVPVPHAAQLKTIKRWFWKTSLSGHFGGWNTGMMGEDLVAVQRFAEQLEDDIPVGSHFPSESLWISKQFRGNYAHAKLLALILAHRKPVDLLNGQVLDVGRALAWSNVKEFHHFFPDDYLKGCGVAGAKANSLANFVMLSSASNKKISNRAPSDYLRQVRDAAGTSLDQWLASNYISRAAFHRALEDDFDGFLAIRSRELHAAACELCV